MACALVTGASRGIGLAVARRLAAGGFRVLSLSRSAPSEPEEGVHHVPCDLADVGALGPLVAGLGPADVLVNNAGVMHAPSWTEYPEELETATLAINLRAPIALMRHVGRGMADRELPPEPTRAQGRRGAAAQGRRNAGGVGTGQGRGACAHRRGVLFRPASL